MKRSEHVSDNLAQMISQLWRHGQSQENRRSTRKTAQEASDETTHPITDVPAIWQHILRMNGIDL